jgi:hypothetical protein
MMRVRRVRVRIVIVHCVHFTLRLQQQQQPYSYLLARIASDSSPTTVSPSGENGIENERVCVCMCVCLCYLPFPPKAAGKLHFRVVVLDAHCTLHTMGCAGGGPPRKIWTGGVKTPQTVQEDQSTATLNSTVSPRKTEGRRDMQNCWRFSLWNRPFATLAFPLGSANHLNVLSARFPSGFFLWRRAVLKGNPFIGSLAIAVFTNRTPSREGFRPHLLSVFPRRRCPRSVAGDARDLHVPRVPKLCGSRHGGIL